jgi:hypothetical protein
MRDPLFAARMAYCGPRGIPLSSFLAWDLHDQEAALAWQSHDAERCKTCGTHPAMWDAEQGGDRNALVPEPYACRGCEQIEQLQQSEEVQGSDVKGLHIRLVPPELKWRPPPELATP